MSTEFVLLIGLLCLTVLMIAMGSWQQLKIKEYLIRLQAQFDSFTNVQANLPKLGEELRDKHDAIRDMLNQKLIENLQVQQDSLQKYMMDIRQQITLTLNNNTDALTKRFDKLTQETDQRLQLISQHVEKRLSEGFEKTTATFTEMIKRLALIDEAQKKITELSSNVVSLQEILVDKRSRGTFGEVQLSALVQNLIPENSFALQYTFSTGKRADCILFLPEPTGNIVIDAKFPLENYRRLTQLNNADPSRSSVESQFRQDIRHHIQDIANKYIIPGETSDGAMMFIPAEAIFAEIHAHFPELVEEAQRHRVWMVSPTTMMAVLTTARAVLKDTATRKQIHIIQEHLGLLAKDFLRFQQRMTNLAKHIDQAQADVKDVKISADKITHRFAKIEQVDLRESKLSTALLEEEVD